MKKLIINKQVAYTIPEKPNSRLQQYQLTILSILNILFLVAGGLLDMPVFYLSKHIIEHKQAYYRKLRDVTCMTALPPDMSTAWRYVFNMSKEIEYMDLLSKYGQIMGISGGTALAMPFWYVRRG